MDNGALDYFPELLSHFEIKIREVRIFLLDEENFVWLKALLFNEI